MANSNSRDNRDDNHSLLPRPLASAVSTVSTLTRLSLKTADYLTSWMFYGAKYGVSSCLSISRNMALTSIDLLDRVDRISKNIIYGRRSTRRITSGTSAATTRTEIGEHQEEDDGDLDLRDLDEQEMNLYLSIFSLAVHKGFEAAESLVETGIDTLNDYSTATIKTADDFVHLLDGIFGSTETSHAVSVFLSLVRHEMFTDREDSPSIVSLGINNVLKSAIAYSILQIRTRRRRLQYIPHRILLSVYVDKQTGWASSTTSATVQEQLRILIGPQSDDSTPSENLTSTRPPSVLADHKSEFEISWDNNYKSVTRAPSVYGVVDSQPHLKPFHESFAHIIQNLSTFARYSSSLYGRQFLRIFQIGQYAKPPRATFDSFGRIHCEPHVIFSSHSQVPLEHLVGSSFRQEQDLLAPIPRPQIDTPEFIICIDDSRKLVVATLRGTFGLSDVLTSLSCQIFPLAINNTTYKVHSGMMMQAEALAMPGSQFHSLIKLALEDYPGYGLVLNGHSLGGGVASLVGLLWSNLGLDSHSADTYVFWTSDFSRLPPFRPIHVYVFGSPCVMCDELSRAVRGLVTSVVHQDDFISRLSLGGVRDLKQVAHLLSSESQMRDRNKNICNDIISKTLNQTKSTSSRSNGASDEKSEVVLYDLSELSNEETTSRRNSEDEDQREREESDWYWSIHSALLASSSNEKLYPPGDVYWLTCEGASQEMERNSRSAAPKTTKDYLFDFKSDSMTANIRSIGSKSSFATFNNNNNPTTTTTTTTTSMNNNNMKASIGSSKPAAHGTPPRKDTKSNNGGVGSSANKENSCVLKMIQIETVESLFGEMQLSSTMILDHSPGRYEWVLQTMAQNT